MTSLPMDDPRRSSIPRPGLSPPTTSMTMALRSKSGEAPLKRFLAAVVGLGEV